MDMFTSEMSCRVCVIILGTLFISLSSYGTYADNMFKSVENNSDNSNVKEINAVEGIKVSDVPIAEDHHEDYIFNSSNIRDITITEYIGHGISKHAYMGEYRGRRVVLRIPRSSEDTKACTEETDVTKTNLRDNECYSVEARTLLSEIYFQTKLHHPNIARLLGYCLKCQFYNGTSMSSPGPVLVTEYGEPQQLYAIPPPPWILRLNYVKQIAGLLHYLETSPLGSLRWEDLKFSHFVLINSQQTMIDLDTLWESEPACGQSGECELDVMCEHELCSGYNAKYNMKRLYSSIRILWFQAKYFPADIQLDILVLGDELSRLELDSSGLIDRIDEILDIWDSMHSEL